MSEADRRLSEESEQRFLDLYAHLLVYINDRFDVIDEIETVADLEQHYTDGFSRSETRYTTSQRRV